MAESLEETRRRLLAELASGAAAGESGGPLLPPACKPQARAELKEQTEFLFAHLIANAGRTGGFEELKTKFDDENLWMLIDRFQVFDHCANLFQAQRHRRLIRICAGALGFLILFEFFAHYPIHQLAHYIPVLEPFEKTGFWPALVLGLLCLVYSVVVLGRITLKRELIDGSNKTQRAYLDARCIAEVLRIAIFWRLNGIGHRLTNQIPAAYRPTRLWIVEAVLRPLLDPLQEDPGPISDERRQITREQWEFDQCRYFARSYHRQHLVSECWSNVSMDLFLCGLAGVVAIICASVAGVPKESVLVEVMLTVSPILIVMSAMAEFYLERQGFEVNVRRYEYAEEIFQTPWLRTDPFYAKHDSHDGGLGAQDYTMFGAILVFGVSFVTALRDRQSGLALTGMAVSPLIVLVGLLLTRAAAIRRSQGFKLSPTDEAEWLHRRTEASEMLSHDDWDGTFTWSARKRCMSSSTGTFPRAIGPFLSPRANHVSTSSR